MRIHTDCPTCKAGMSYVDTGIRRDRYLRCPAGCPLVVTGHPSRLEPAVLEEAEAALGIPEGHPLHGLTVADADALIFRVYRATGWAIPHAVDKDGRPAYARELRALLLAPTVEEAAEAIRWWDCWESETALLDDVLRARTLGGVGVGPLAARLRMTGLPVCIEAAAAIDRLCNGWRGGIVELEGLAWLARQAALDEEGEGTAEPTTDPEAQAVLEPFTTEAAAAFLDAVAPVNFRAEYQNEPLPVPGARLRGGAHRGGDGAGAGRPGNAACNDGVRVHPIAQHAGGATASLERANVRQVLPGVDAGGYPHHHLHELRESPIAPI